MPLYIQILILAAAILVIEELVSSHVYLYLLKSNREYVKKTKAILGECSRLPFVKNTITLTKADAYDAFNPDSEIVTMYLSGQLDKGMKVLEANDKKIKACREREEGLDTDGVSGYFLNRFDKQIKDLEDGQGSLALTWKLNKKGRCVQKKTVFYTYDEIVQTAEDACKAINTRMEPVIYELEDFLFDWAFLKKADYSGCYVIFVGAEDSTVDDIDETYAEAYVGSSPNVLKSVYKQVRGRGDKKVFDSVCDEDKTVFVELVPCHEMERDVMREELGERYVDNIHPHDIEKINSIDV